MSHTLAFTIPGPPVPKGRWRSGFDKATRKRVAYTPTRTKEYQELVAACGMEAYAKDRPVGWPVTDQQMKCVLMIYHCKAISHPHTPDGDNVEKAVLDALQKVLYKNDKYVTDVHKISHYNDDNPRVEVRIETIGG